MGRGLEWDNYKTKADFLNVNLIGIFCDSIGIVYDSIFQLFDSLFQLGWQFLLSKKLHCESAFCLVLSNWEREIGLYHLKYYHLFL